MYFYPRSPCGERLPTTIITICIALFLSTLSLRRATWPGLLARPFFIISIHALLAESDCYSLRHSAQMRHFYPRSPCGERPRTKTPIGCACTYFYPRSPCGERPSAKSTPEDAKNFYPRSPCGERHLGRLRKFLFLLLFLSTLSLRRATAKVHKTVGHFCAYETNFMEIASSC